MKEQQMNLVLASYKDTPVSFNTDGFLNATKVAKQFNKRTKDFLRTKETKEYVSELAKTMGRICLTEQNQIVTVVQGGDPENQGTWIHPKLAIYFARWCSANFAVWCDQQIEKILKDKILKCKIQDQKVISGKEQNSFAELMGAIFNDNEGTKEEQLTRALKSEKMKRELAEKQLCKLQNQLIAKSPMQQDEFEKIYRLKPFHSWKYIARYHSHRSAKNLSDNFHKFAKENGYN